MLHTCRAEVEEQIMESRGGLALNVLFAGAVVVMTLQLFPFVGTAVLSAVDVRNWSWTIVTLFHLAILLGLVSLKRHET